MIEPVLRRAPQQRAPSESTAAFLRSAKAEANLPDSTRPTLESSAAAGSQSNPNRSDSAQEELYMQQVQDALREGSPDVRRDARSAPQQVQKRPTSKVAPRRQRPVSPAQQAQQDLSERYCCIQTHVTFCSRAALQLLRQMHVQPHAQSAKQQPTAHKVTGLTSFANYACPCTTSLQQSHGTNNNPKFAVCCMLHCIETSGNLVPC